MTTPSSHDVDPLSLEVSDEGWEWEERLISTEETSHELHLNIDCATERFQAARIVDQLYLSLVAAGCTFDTVTVFLVCVVTGTESQ